MWERIKDIFKAFFHDWLDKAEDPEKMIKYTVLKMQEDVFRAKNATVKAIAGEKTLFRQWQGFVETAQKMHQSALLALKQGNESLARRALEKQHEAQIQAQEFEKMHEISKKNNAKIKEDIKKLEEKLYEARLKEGGLIARSQLAKAMTMASKSLMSSDDKMSKIDQMEDKILKSEAEATAFMELSEDNTKNEMKEMNDFFKNNDIESELAKLKKELGK